MKPKIIKEDSIDQIFPSRLRKKFNREYPLSVGDLVRAGDGIIGEFQGISTYKDPSQITVILYKIDLRNNETQNYPDNLKFQNIKKLPENFMGVQIRYQITKKPKIY